MKGATPAMSLDASADGFRWPDRRVPPIGTGELDSLALLRFETLDAIVLAESVLAETRALRDWMQELQGRLPARLSPAPALAERVAAVAAAGLSSETVERLLSTMDELLGQLNAECGSRVDAEPGR